MNFPVESKRRAGSNLGVLSVQVSSSPDVAVIGLDVLDVAATGLDVLHVDLIVVHALGDDLLAVHVRPDVLRVVAGSSACSPRICSLGRSYSLHYFDSRFALVRLRLQLVLETPLQQQRLLFLR